eukprot:3324346-Karenia_brevis.AAC.1
MLVRRTNADTIARLKAHAKNMADAARELHPPLYLDSPECCLECIGGNHLTCLLRMYEAGMTSEVSKVAFVPPADDKDLQQVVESGHVYYILKDGIPDSDM